MPRITHIAWWCGQCGTKNDAQNRTCTRCTANKVEKCAQIHASERAVVYYNPATGEHRTPARADAPLPEVYQQQGYERREIMSMSAWEREAGVVHEPTNFHPGNEGELADPREVPKVPAEVKDELVRDMAAAFASGPWTGADKLV